MRDKPVTQVLADLAERLIRDGRMPALDQLLDTMDQARLKYARRVREGLPDPLAEYLQFFAGLTATDVERLKLAMPRTRKQ